MKFPGDKSDKNSNDFLDPKTPDLIDGILADIVRNFLGLGYYNAVDPNSISIVPVPKMKDLDISSPRSSIATFNKDIITPQFENTAEIKKLLVPFGASFLFSEQMFDEIHKIFHQGSLENFDRPDINFSEVKNPSFSRLDFPTFMNVVDHAESSSPRNDLSPRANIDKHSAVNSTHSDFNPEPQSLFDIFFDKNSPYSLIDSVSSALDNKFKGDLFFGHDRNNGEQKVSTVWSSVSVVTSADGITRTRKTVKHADGTEETTETISGPQNNWPSSNIKPQEDILDSSRLQPVIIPKHSSNFFGTIAQWWHHVSA